MEKEIKTKLTIPLPVLLPFIILVEGFLCIGIEILTLRQLLPVVGGSVIVTSLIIGFFLLFLAMGYRKGGRLKNNLQKTLRSNLFISALWVGIGLSYLFVMLFFDLTQKIVGYHLIRPLIAYLFLIIAPLIYLLGQTVPIAMNMVKQNKSNGAILGDTLGLSTVGSFLGATITTILLMQYLGVAWTIFINFSLLLLLAFLLTPPEKSLWFEGILSLTLIGIIYWVNINAEKTFFVLTNDYANYEILTSPKFNLKEGEKVLVINNAWSSYTNSKKEGFPYIQKIKNILFDDLKLSNADILVLGAGGFSLSAENTHGNRFTYVDIDDSLKTVTIPHFLAEMKSQLIIDDARHYLNHNQKKYQAIVIDTYTDPKSIPSYLLTKEFMLAIKQTLDKNGVAIFNIIANPLLADPYSKRIDNTIHHIFKNCSSIPERYANSPTNLLYVCSNMHNQNDRLIYSDNLNTSTTDSFNW